MNMNTEGFGELLQQAEQLTADMDTGSELPRIERNLHQIMEAGERLWSKTAQTVIQDSADVKASILLGSKGVDIPGISQRLEALSAAKSFEPLEPVRDTDIEGFLRNERENALLAAIEETRTKTFEQAEKNHWESMRSEWEQEKQRILHALIGSDSDLVDFPQEAESIVSQTVDLHTRSAMDNVQMAYARQVYVYNDRIVRGMTKPDLIRLFEEMALKLDDKNVVDLWQIVRLMTQVPIKASRDVAAGRSSRQMQAAFVRQARHYLESSYQQFIATTVYGNLGEVQAAGAPAFFHLVHSFLNIKLAPMPPPGLEDGLVDGKPVWTMIYYCIRCGELEAAMEVVNKSTQQLGEFRKFLEEYIRSEDRRLLPNTESELQLHYRRSVKRSTDPYKKAVYCVLGCCDPNDNHIEIADKTDDYLWLKLCQLHYEVGGAGSVPPPSPADKLTLVQLQSTLYEDYGEAHFNAHQQPFLYFRVLFLTAQFEAAVEFLSRVDHLRCHAVHVAIVLFQQGLLLLPDSLHTQLLIKDARDPVPMRRLNFTYLITMYTRTFESTDPREALQYFYFLRNIKDKEGESLFMKCISELVTETREFEALLGCMGADGMRRPGAIDSFNVDTQKVVELVACHTEDKGLFEESVGLYDLAGNHDKVVELLNKLLSPVLSSASGPHSNRDRLKNMALAIAERYRKHGLKASTSNTVTFYLILDLLSFFDQYHMGNTDEALEIIKKLNILPFTSDAIKSCVDAFKNLTDEARHNIAAVLLATMNILYTKYKRARSTGTTYHSPSGAKIEDGGRESFVTYLRLQARALIVYAGMIPYRLPGDANARLVQIEILMN